MLNRNRRSVTVSLLALFLSFLSLPAWAQEAEKEKIPLEELLKSKAAQLFQLRDYDAALLEFQNLSRQYPRDSLPVRYTGMTLTLLGRLDDAVTTLENAVNLDAGNAANHYYLARALHEQGARKRAEEELSEVIRLDTEKGFYGSVAKNALEIVREKERYKVSKSWEIFGSTGYQYDSNVIIEPNDKGAGGTADQNAGRYYLNLGGTDKWLERGKFTSKAGYQLYQSLHDDGLDEFNFTSQEFSIDNQYRTKQWGKEVTWGLRYELPWGFLNGNLFSFGNEIVVSMRIRLTKNTRTEIYHRYSHFEYGPDGRDAGITSRDGEYNVTGILHRHYFSNFSRYVFAGYQIESGATEGNNFDHVGHDIRLGFHTPLIWGLVFDALGQLSVANYYHYSAEFSLAEPLARRDNDWTLFFSLTYPLSVHWSVRASYRYENANNRNDFFQYDRHIGGLELRFRY